MTLTLKILIFVEYRYNQKDSARVGGPEDGKIGRGEVGPDEGGLEEFDTNSSGGKERTKMMKNDGKGWRFEEVGGSVEAWTHRRSLWNGEALTEGSADHVKSLQTIPMHSSRR